MKHFLALLSLAIITSPALAAKDGGFVGIGIGSTEFRSDDSQVDDSFKGERKTSWRLEGGYIWDIGKPGGFMLGVAGAYDNFGSIKVDDDDLPNVDWKVESSAITAYFVGQQEIAEWVDFSFKIGPSIIYNKLEVNISNWSGDGDGTYGGVGSMIGFTFYPSEQFAIELASHSVAFVDNSDVFMFRTLGVNLQYRF